MVEILYKYLILNNKVAIPGVGNFYIQRQPAYLDFSKKRFISPQLQILFTENAIAPDKNFFSFFANEHQTDEAAAVKYFSEFSHNLTERINTTGSAELSGLGQIVKNASGTLQFIQTKQIESFFPDVAVERVVNNASQPNIILPSNTGKKNNEVLAIAREEDQLPAQKKDYWWLFATILALSAIAAIIYYYKLNGSLR